MKAKDVAPNFDHERIDPNTTADQLSLLDAYEYSRVICLNLDAERRACPSGSGINTVKDLRKAIRETPFWKFQRAQVELLDLVDAHRRNGTYASREALGLTVATFVHGTLLSTGCRRSEVCHLREGNNTHVLEGSRHVALRAIDRKNEKMHECELRERWLPGWFIEHYLKEVRPLISVNDRTACKTKPFLVMNPYGKRPYGCSEENADDGSGRDSRAFRNSKKQIGNLWKVHVATAFVTLGFHVPSEKQQFGMHIIRNVGGHAVFMTKGLEKAAHFLGDSVGSVEGVYAALKGESVDTSLLEDV